MPTLVGLLLPEATTVTDRYKDTIVDWKSITEKVYIGPVTVSSTGSFSALSRTMLLTDPNVLRLYNERINKTKY